MRAYWLVLAVVACGKAPPSGSSARDGVVAAWKQGGLEPSPFAAATTDVGADCASGTVNKIDVLLCTFPTPGEAQHAVEAGLKWVGETTGSSQARGSVLISAADRHKADPSGRTINQLFKLP